MIYAALIPVAVVSYLVGGVNGAMILSRLVYHEDIREKGSKNPGFTNFKRVHGMNGVTILVMLIDVLKTLVPVLLSCLLFRGFWQELGFAGAHEAWQIAAQFSGLFCMLGHAFPVWYGFRGGKAFLAGATTVWFVDWRMALIALGVFLLVLFTLRYMSLSSILAAATCPVVLAFLTPGVFLEVLAVLASVLVIARHYPNIVRLLRGSESKFHFGNKHA